MANHPQGFVVAPRGGAGSRLIESGRQGTGMNAFVLLYTIAQRCRYADMNDGLKVGQCYISTHELPLTRRQTRTAISVLESASQIATETTNRGTVVTLINTDIFDIFGKETTSETTSEKATRRPRDDQRDDHETTTKEHGNKVLNSINSRRRRRKDRKEVEIGTLDNPHFSSDGPRYKAGKYLDYDQNQIPPTWEDVQRFCTEASISADEASKWFNYNAHPRNNWTARAPSGKRSAMKSWCHALRKWGEKSVKWNPQLDSMSNEQFWQWFNEEFSGDDEAGTAVEYWIDVSSKRGWKTENPMTGAMEPISDYKAAFKGYYEKWTEDESQSFSAQAG